MLCDFNIPKWKQTNWDAIKKYIDCIFRNVLIRLWWMDIAALLAVVVLSSSFFNHRYVASHLTTVSIFFSPFFLSFKMLRYIRFIELLPVFVVVVVSVCTVVLLTIKKKNPFSEIIIFFFLFLKNLAFHGSFFIFFLSFMSLLIWYRSTFKNQYTKLKTWSKYEIHLTWMINHK